MNNKYCMNLTLCSSISPENGNVLGNTNHMRWLEKKGMPWSNKFRKYWTDYPPPLRGIYEVFYSSPAAWNRFLFNFIVPKLWHGEGNGTPLQCSCLENPMDEEPGGQQSTWSLRVGHDWVTSLSLFTFMHWRRKWQPTPVFLPGESQGTGEPGGLPSTGSHRVGHNWRDLAAAASFDSDTLNITIVWGNAAAQSQIHTVFVIHCYVLFS